MVTNTSSGLGTLSFISALAALLFTGCTVPTTVGSDTSLSAAGLHATALRWPPPQSPPSSSSSSNSSSSSSGGFSSGSGGGSGDEGGQGGGFETGTLELRIDSEELSCSASFGGEADDHPACDPDGWLFTLIVPPAYQVPGVYSLSDLQGEAFSTGGGCLATAANSNVSIAGTIEVVSSDTSSLQMRLSQVRLGNKDFPGASGDYDVPVCAWQTSW